MNWSVDGLPSMLAGRKPLGTVCYLGGVAAVLEEFCWAWGQMVQYNQELLCGPTEYIHYDRVKFSDHAPARNTLAARMLGNWIIMLDTDHQFEPDIVHRLLRMADEIGADVLSGLYRYKTPPYSPVAFMSTEKWTRGVVSLDKKAKAMEVSAFGAGCLFMRSSVLARIAKECKCGPFDRISGFSEDHSFCKRCREIGISTWIAPNIEAPHLRVCPVTDEDAEPELAGTSDDNQVEVKGFK